MEFPTAAPTSSAWIAERNCRTTGRKCESAARFTDPPRRARSNLLAPRLHVHNRERLRQVLDGIAPRRGAVFVSDVAGEAEVRDSLSDKFVVQLLSVVEFVAVRYAYGVEMRDPLDVLADVMADVAVHGLHMINVEQHLHAR